MRTILRDLFVVELKLHVGEISYTCPSLLINKQASVMSWASGAANY